MWLRKHAPHHIRLIRLILPTGAVCGSSVCRLYFLGNAVPHTGEKTSSFSPLTPLSGLSRATPMFLGLSRRIIAPALRGATACGVLSTSLAAYCSVSAHPRNCCCSAFALSGQKFIRMRPARSAATASHPWRKVTTVDILHLAPVA